MRYLRRTSGSVWGPTLPRMRVLYLAMIRPLITYGCGAWFVRGSNFRWRLSNVLMDELESLQYQCLVHISGAFNKISKEYLFKELYIEPLEIHLRRSSLAFRARALGLKFQNSQSQIPKSLNGQKPPLRLTNAQQNHPYHALDCQALLLYDHAHQFYVAQKNKVCKWGDSKTRAKVIKQCAQEMAEEWASRRWEAWRTNRQVYKRKCSPALWNDWGQENLDRFGGLTRAQSTILLQCRTGVGGFRSYLFRRKAKERFTSQGKTTSRIDGFSL